MLELLLRRGETELVERTLDGMAAGGMYDLVGGGFHRYSVDERWLVPHFEKMLYDNALLVPAYLHGWLVTGRERYREVAEETVEYMLRDLLLPEGAFASSQDADTDGVEGLTYTWTADDAVPPELLAAVRARALDRPRRARLRAARGICSRSARERPQPGLDDKAIASWNGLALAALAEAARRLERDDWRDAARGLAEFLLGPLSDGGRLRRSYRDGKATGTGYLDDYANVAHGLYELHVATGELRWLRGVAPPRAARRRALRRRRARRLLPHARPTARRSSCARRTSTTTRRRRATRCSRTSCCGWRGSTATTSWSGTPSPSCASSATSLPRAPSAFGWALCALDLHFSPPREIAIVGSPDDEVAKAALAGYDPNAVVAFGPSEEVPLLRGKDLVDGRPAVYVCERFACQAPVTDPLR